MHRLLLVSAALFATALISPAEAQQFADSGFNGHQSQHRGSPQFAGRHDRGFDCGVRFDRGVRFNGRDRFDGRDRRDHHRGRRAELGNCDVFLPWYGGEWALYNNRSWEPDSYNDWWHDRPDRSFPRWVKQNQNCEPDRMWWSGSGWHC